MLRPSIDAPSNGADGPRRRRGGAGAGAEDFSTFLASAKPGSAADELQASEAQVKRLEKANKRLTDELKEALDRGERLEDEVRRRERLNNEASTKLEDAARKQKQDAERDQRELSAKLEALQSKLEDVKTDFEEKVEKEKIDGEKKASQLSAEVAELKKKLREDAEDPRVSALEAKLKSEKEERTQSEGENRKLEQRIRELERTIDTKDRTITELKSDLDEKTKEATDLSSEKDSSAKELRQLRKDSSELEDVRKELTKTTEKLESSQKEVKDAQKKIDDLETEKRRLERDNGRSGSSSSASSERDTTSSARGDSTTSTSTYTSRYSRADRTSARDVSEGSGRTGRNLERTLSNEKSSRESSTSREPSVSRRSRYGSESESTPTSTTDSAVTKNQIQRLERELERRTTEADEKVSAAELEQKRLQSLYEKEKSRADDLEKVLKQDRVEGKQSVDLAIGQVSATGKQLLEAQTEISKLQKALQKKDRDLDDLKLKHEELTTQNSNTKNTLSKTDTQGKSTERALQNTERKLKDAESKYEKSESKLTQTTEELRTTKQALEEARTELASEMKNFDATVKCLEEELYEETISKDKLLKAKSEIETELRMLQWYFAPLHDKASLRQYRQFQTLEFSFAEASRNAIKEELEKVAKTPQLAKTLASAQKSLQAAMTHLPEDYQDDYKAELFDLTEALGRTSINTTGKWAILSLLVQYQVDLGVIRELTNVTIDFGKDTAGGTPYSLNAPDLVVKMALREAKGYADDPKAVSNALLQKLGEMRAKKTRKDVEYSKIVILEGGEYDD